MSTNRRTFLKTIAVTPVAASVGSSAWASPKHDRNYKFKLSLNCYSFNSLLRDGTIDLFDVLDFCAGHNFDAIDPTGYYFPGYPDVPDDAYINRFKRRAFLLGLDISGTGVRNDFATPDEASRQADTRMIAAWVAAAAKLGSTNIRIFPGKGDYTGHSRDDVFGWMADDIKACCAFGEHYGVMIALQNHNDFLKTSADVERLFEMVDSEWLGLNLDIGSLRQGNPYDEIARIAKLAVTWQLKENVWIDGQETPTDFARLIPILRKAGYRGYLPIETLGAGDPYEKIPALLERVRRGIADTEQREARS